MPFRIVPRSYSKLHEFIRKIDQKTNGVALADLPFSAEAWQAYQAARAIFLKEYQEFRNSDAMQQKATNAATDSWNILYLFVSHFIQVFNFAVSRKKFPASSRAYYGLEAASALVPTLNSEAQLTSWANNIVTGEAARTAAGEQAMAFPAASEVAAALNVFNSAQKAQADSKLAANKELADVGKVFQSTVDAVMDLYAELEFANRKESPAYIRNLLREYGMQYRNASGEALEETLTIPAGGKLVYDAVTLGEETTITLTLLTNATGIRACRNQAEGCATNGLELAFNAPLQASLANLPGGDDVLVLSNGAAVEVMVKVKVVG